MSTPSTTQTERVMQCPSPVLLSDDEDIITVGQKRTAAEASLQERCMALSPEYQAKFKKPIVPLGVKEVSRGKSPSLTVSVTTGSSVSGKTVVVVRVKSAFAAGAQYLKKLEYPYKAMYWNEDAMCHECEVRSCTVTCGMCL